MKRELTPREVAALKRAMEWALEAMDEDVVDAVELRDTEPEQLSPTQEEMIEDAEILTKLLAEVL